MTSDQKTPPPLGESSREAIENLPPLEASRDTESSGAGDVLANIAAVPTTDSELAYLATNVLYCRGAMSKDLRREAVIAIKTYRDILQAAREALRTTGGAA